MALSDIINRIKANAGSSGSPSYSLQANTQGQARIRNAIDRLIGKAASNDSPAYQVSAQPSGQRQGMNANFNIEQPELKTGKGSGSFGDEEDEKTKAFKNKERIEQESTLGGRMAAAASDLVPNALGYDVGYNNADAFATDGGGYIGGWKNLNPVETAIHNLNPTGNADVDQFIEDMIGYIGPVGAHDIIVPNWAYNPQEDDKRSRKNTNVLGAPKTIAENGEYLADPWSIAVVSADQRADMNEKQNMLYDQMMAEGLDRSAAVALSALGSGAGSGIKGLGSPVLGIRPSRNSLRGTSDEVAAKFARMAGPAGNSAIKVGNGTLATAKDAAKFAMEDAMKTGEAQTGSWASELGPLETAQKEAKAFFKGKKIKPSEEAKTLKNALKRAEKQAKEQITGKNPYTLAAQNRAEKTIMDVVGKGKGQPLSMNPGLEGAEIHNMMKDKFGKKLTKQIENEWIPNALAENGGKLSTGDAYRAMRALEKAGKNPYGKIAPAITGLTVAGLGAGLGAETNALGSDNPESPENIEANLVGPSGKLKPSTQAEEYYNYLKSDDSELFREMYPQYTDPETGYSALRASGDMGAWAYLTGLDVPGEGIDKWKNRYLMSGVNMLDQDNALSELEDYLYGENAINIVDYMMGNSDVRLANDADAIADMGRYLYGTYNWQFAPELLDKYGVDLDAYDAAAAALGAQVSANGWSGLDLDQVNKILNQSGEKGMLKRVKSNSDEYEAGKWRENADRSYGSRIYSENYVPYDLGNGGALYDQDLTGFLMNAYNQTHPDDKLILAFD